jgi:hypothetical protein
MKTTGAQESPPEPGSLGARTGDHEGHSGSLGARTGGHKGHSGSLGQGRATTRAHHSTSTPRSPLRYTARRARSARFVVYRRDGGRVDAGWRPLVGVRLPGGTSLHVGVRPLFHRQNPCGRPSHASIHRAFSLFERYDPCILLCTT